MRTLKLIVILIILIGFSASVNAQWNPNTRINNPVSNTAQTQFNSVVIYDGSGGVIIGWLDNRDGFTRVYAQRYNSAGIPQWAANGVLVTPENGPYLLPNTRLKIIADGSGGAIFSFCAAMPNTSYLVYSQKINSSGQIQWLSMAGAAIDNPTSSYDEQFDIASDNNGGVIIAFRRWNPSGIVWEVSTQRINSSGARMWGNYGVKVVQAVNGVEEPVICQDNNSGAIIAWKEARTGQIYSQRVNSNGVTQWTANGMAVFPNALNSRYNAKIISDGVGGAIISVEDARNTGSTVYDIYAQRIIDNFRLWGEGGKVVCNNSANQRYSSMISDKTGGAYIAWVDYRNTIQEIYLQRMDPNGNPIFLSNGISTSLTQAYEISLSNYDANSLIITSVHSPGGDTTFISAQKFSNTGTAMWGSANTQVCNNPRPKSLSKNASVMDNNGNVIITWTDIGLNPSKVFAQKTTGLTNINSVEGTARSFSLSQNYPNPFNPVTKILFDVPANVNGQMSTVNLSVYNISGKLIETLVNSSIPGGSYEVQFNASSLASGTYFYRLTAGDFVQTKKMLLVK